MSITDFFQKYYNNLLNDSECGCSFFYSHVSPLISHSTRLLLTDLSVNPLWSLMSLLNSAIEMHRKHVLGTGLLPRITITKPIISFLNLNNNNNKKFQYFIY